ncbi:MAG: hypothetical protein K2G89_04435, partial [Lachnospiraceae bacterium]|nr:hypothetical protein [Lachnospiraceae bacterium]
LLRRQRLLCIRDILNAVYFVRAISVIFDVHYTKERDVHPAAGYAFACIIFCVLNFALGMNAQPLLDAIRTGLGMFA